MDGDKVTHANGRECKQKDGKWTVVRFEGAVSRPEGQVVDAGLVQCTMPHPLMTLPIADGELDGAPPLKEDEWNIMPGAVVAPADYPRIEITPEGIKVNYGSSGFQTEATTDDARWILTEALPDVISNFLTNNTKYARAQTGHDLGEMGIIPDINRKTSVLISRVWDHSPAGSGESTEEVIGDLIGHLLLMLAKRRRK